MAQSRLARLIGELRVAPSRAQAEAALARLRVVRDPAGSTIEIRDRDDAAVARETLGSLRGGETAIVHITRGVYMGIPTSAARARLLVAARDAARDAVLVHVPVVDDGTHVSRAILDAPRRILRRVGAAVPEPGDRFERGRLVHCFFDDEALLDEFARADLVVTKRDGFSFVLKRAGADEEQRPRERADSFTIELARVVPLVPAVDRARRNETPERALAAIRAMGGARITRGPIGRARLRRAVGWVDALMPGGASCYRRILLEVALDGGAARETVVFGLDVGATGHVAFDGREERTFDVSFAIPAEGSPAEASDSGV